MSDNFKQKIKQFYTLKGRMPVYSELLKITGFSSKNAVYKLINRLVDDGFINKDDKGKITLSEPMSSGMPFLGLIEAGLPTDTESDLLDYIDLDEMFNDYSGKTFMLEVKGLSMIDECIKEGDYVIVEKTDKAQINDIVIAEVDGGFTMKYLKKKGNTYYLKAANSDFDDIYPTTSFSIVAKVKGVVRKYD